MRYRVLGPLRVDGVDITATRDRIVLAVLLADAGRIVSGPRIIEALWDGTPPATARAQVQSAVFRLRRTLPAGAIVTDPAG